MKGKHSPHTSMNSGKYKTKGYTSTDEASDAWMKLYERPVILDSNGKVIGYQEQDKRRAYTKLAYEYLNSKYGKSQIPAQEPSPYIAKPVSTAVRPTIPAEQTVPVYDTKISPYVSGKPMLKLRPRVQLPNLIELMEDSEWEPGFPGLKNGKLPRYRGGKHNDDIYKNMIYGRHEVEDKEPQYQKFINNGVPEKTALRWTKEIVNAYPDNYFVEGPTLPEVTIKPDPNSMSTALLTTYYPWSVDFPVTGHSTLELIHDDEGSSGFVTAYMDDPWYNFITNNCSDATRNAIESATGKKINPMFFTTPGDVKDFVENNLGGKSKYDRRGFSETIFNIPTKQARKIVEYARKQSAIIHKLKHRE
ncbi:hypothetical protein [Segatella bryantii]|uniref:hypothetical protein n=1 Tax=Segatella bryantii TaxID=77095 RepID=UPI002430D0E8|nr:hypothetical protein [Segatella bryantii]